MTKTIEEAARDFVANYYDLEEYGDEVSDIEIDNSEECFIEGANYILSLPLSQRLTDEERELVRKMYKDELEMAQHFHAKAKASNDVSCRQHYYGLREPYISRMELLQRIFGKELLGEGEG